MGQALIATRGMPRMAEVPGSGTDGIYDETFTVTDVGGLSSGSIITLPNSGQYTDKDLRVFFNGQLWEEGVDYNYVGVAPRTQIQLLRFVDQNEVLRFRVEGDSGAIYDEVIVIGSGGLSAGSLITLPGLKTYNDIDLKVYLNGQYLEVVEDYNYVGSIPRTQIQTVIDLFENERLRLRIEG